MAIDHRRDHPFSDRGHGYDRVPVKVYWPRYDRSNHSVDRTVHHETSSEIHETTLGHRSTVSIGNKLELSRLNFTM